MLVPQNEQCDPPLSLLLFPMLMIVGPCWTGGGGGAIMTG